MYQPPWCGTNGSSHSGTSCPQSRPQPSLELQLFSPAPVHKELEAVRLAGSLSFLAEILGGSHPLVLKVLAGQSHGFFWQAPQETNAWILDWVRGHS